ncbi:hypothetical protein CKO_01603 [Citrobacter koseri ATCC BAA-895]|uniref:Uncharacterized protein n=1 Tax=Citrobacter koseri (strain ATCC BAA-895 / CDC 4225-83 / SGSC4696) TaxID=290338 RepID=A8AGX1_CITK8|nr:hypothetical protein CKO_01603 [Citrobacter koseri ATCC BAA-895]
MARGSAIELASALCRRFSRSMFYRFFGVFFRCLRFLFRRFLSRCFVVFFVMRGFCRCGFSGCRSRSRRGRCRFSSKCSRRQTHSSGNNQS